MDGVVNQLEVFTIGAVARAGEQLLRVVPKDQDVENEAIFTNSDIGFVEVGQNANINLDAYPSARFGFVTGVVTDVAAGLCCTNRCLSALPLSPDGFILRAL